VTYISTSFKVIITPPYKSPTLCNIKLYSSCKGSVSHTFTEPGTHRIEVLLNGIHINGSPLSVVVYPPPNRSIPDPRWSLGDIILDKHSSSVIEALFQKREFTRNPEIFIASTDHKWHVDFRQGKATRKQWIINIEEPLVRNIWFWTDDQNKLVPYSSEHAQALEDGFIKGTQDKVFVNDSVKNKSRWVKKEEEGEYQQYRLNCATSRPEGRKVYRGYYGQSLDLNPVPLLWQFKRALLRVFLDRLPKFAIL